MVLNIFLVIQPKGALTAKPYAFKVRSWELNSIETVDLTDLLNSPIYIQYKANKIVRVISKKNKRNSGFISDNCRFCFTCSISQGNAGLESLNLISKYQTVTGKFSINSNLKLLMLVDKKLNLGGKFNGLLNFTSFVTYFWPILIKLGYLVVVVGYLCALSLILSSIIVGVDYNRSFTKNIFGIIN